MASPGTHLAAAVVTLLLVASCCLGQYANDGEMYFTFKNRNNGQGIRFVFKPNPSPPRNVDLYLMYSFGYYAATAYGKVFYQHSVLDKSNFCKMKRYTTGSDSYYTCDVIGDYLVAGEYLSYGIESYIRNQYLGWTSMTSYIDEVLPYCTMEPKRRSDPDCRHAFIPKTTTKTPVFTEPQPTTPSWYDYEIDEADFTTPSADMVSEMVSEASEDAVTTTEFMPDATMTTSAELTATDDEEPLAVADLTNSSESSGNATLINLVLISLPEDYDYEAEDMEPKASTESELVVVEARTMPTIPQMSETTPTKKVQTGEVIVPPSRFDANFGVHDTSKNERNGIEAIRHSDHQQHFMTMLILLVVCGCLTLSALIVFCCYRGNCGRRQTAVAAATGQPSIYYSEQSLQFEVKPPAYCEKAELDEVVDFAIPMPEDSQAGDLPVKQPIDA